jgi:hypothetical protein
MTEREIKDSALRKLGAALMVAGVAVFGFIVGLAKGQSEGKAKEEKNK